MFIIGDLHIQNVDEADVYIDYLNNKEENLLILLGDIIDFHKEFLEEIDGISENKMEEQFRLLINSYWEVYKYFFNNLKKKTIAFLGGHEWFAMEYTQRLEIIPNIGLKNRKIKIFLNNFEEIKYGSIIITGLTIPGNGNSNDFKFREKKKEIENYVREKMKGYVPTNPENTILCTHDPTDIYYKNQGLPSLTELLRKYPYKSHFHAHIHSNINNRIISTTPSINRSIKALARWDLKQLEPISNKLLKIISRV